MKRQSKKQELRTHLQESQTASVGDSSERLSEPLDIPQFRTPPACTTSTGVDTAAMSQTTTDQAAGTSAWPISAGTGIDAMSIAAVSVTTEQSAWHWESWYQKSTKSTKTAPI